MNQAGTPLPILQSMAAQPRCNQVIKEDDAG
jgi:hypothetical protein